MKRQGNNSFQSDLPPTEAEWLAAPRAPDPQAGNRQRAKQRHVLSPYVKSEKDRERVAALDLQL